MPIGRVYSVQNFAYDNINTFYQEFYSTESMLPLIYVVRLLFGKMRERLLFFSGRLKISFFILLEKHTVSNRNIKINSYLLSIYSVYTF